MYGVAGVGTQTSVMGPDGASAARRFALNIAVPVDGVIISETAMAAAAAARFAVLSAGGQDVRSELVAKARENIEQGVYRIQNVVIEVAKHLIPALG